jgi:GT2 family glycosyltransferase/glycosyltransferase involved in cell wall biosynthesis
MDKTVSQYQQVKAIFRQQNRNHYATFRESLRVMIPYQWRRRAVVFLRSHFGIRILGDWMRARLLDKYTHPPKKVFRHGDFYESVTLLPHIPEAEVEAILNHSPKTSHLAKPDVICFSIVDWSFRFQRPQQLMTQFAAHGHRVFYLKVSQFRSQFAQPKFAVQEIRENLYEVEVAARYPLDIFGEVTEGRKLDLLLTSLDELRRAYNINEAISYVMISSWARAALETRRRWNWRVVYDCMDEWENFPGIKPTLLEAEKQLVRECDLLVVTADRLREKWRGYNRPMLLARNAADYDFYAERCKPNNLLDGIKRPIIGYYGAIADWFDLALMAEAAKRRPGYSFVLVGGVFDVDVSQLRSQPNVHLLGQQPYELMPQYLHNFDACVIPFKINPITEATDPVKLYEYLSGGKPVVSVNLPELKGYRDAVYIAENPADFVDKLDLALTEDNDLLRERRKSLARQHTWPERYARIQAELVKTSPRASIIVVTYNNLALTRLCLESLLRNTEYPNYEVIVVDNKSSDDTPKYLSKLAEKHDNLIAILNDTNYGFAKANNQGIERSTGDCLVLLNNDTIVPQGWLSRLLLHLRDPEAGLVGPVTNFVGNEARVEVPYRTWAEMEEFASDDVWKSDQQVADIHMLAMFCVAMRREVFEKVGPLDEQFGIGMFEDDDYSMRVRRAGYRLICAADVFVHHFGQAAFGKLIRSGDYNGLFDENRRKFETKWNIEWKPHVNAPLELKRHLVK